MGNQIAQPKPSQDTATNQLGLTRDATGYLVDSTGQYYSDPIYTAPVQSLGYNIYGTSLRDSSPTGNMSRMNGGGGWGNAAFPMQTNQEVPVEGQLSALGYAFNPFTGSAKGISAGKRSMVDTILANQQPFVSGVPSIDQLFGTQQMSMPASASNSLLGSTASSGAGRFL